MNPDVLRVKILHNTPYVFTCDTVCFITAPSSRQAADPNVFSADNKHHLPVHTVCVQHTRMIESMVISVCTCFTELNYISLDYLCIATLRFVGFLCQK